MTPGNCSDTYLRRSDFYCGCQGAQQQCHLCPDGSPVGFPQRGEKFITGSNCAGIDYLFSLFTSEECTSSTQAYGVDLAAFCECPGTQANGTACSLCPAGKTVASDKLDVSFTSPKGLNVTCKEAQNYSSYIFRDNVCNELMTEARKVCTCVSAAGVLGFATGLLVAIVVTVKMLFH